MATIIEEPETAYRISTWRLKTESIIRQEPIKSMDDNSIIVYSSINLWPDSKLGKVSFKISSLRGKLSKQNEDDVDKEILNLRNEWERDI